MQKTIKRTLLGLTVLLVLVGWYALIMRPWPNQASMTFNEWRELQKAQEQDTQNRSRSASEK
jgi:type II secretory pathway component PulM